MYIKKRNEIRKLKKQIRKRKKTEIKKPGIK